MDKEHKQLLKEAYGLIDFFLGAYAEQTLSSAVGTGDKELLRIAVAEFKSQRQLIEEAEQGEHWGCGKQECDCDEQFQEFVDNELSHA